MSFARTEVLRFLSRKRKAADGDEGPSRRQHRARPRPPPQAVARTPPGRAPEGQQQIRAEGEAAPVDLTADSPPEGPRAGSLSTGAPRPPGSAPALPGPCVEPAADADVRASPPAELMGEEQAPAIPVGGSPPGDARSAPARDGDVEGDALAAIPSRPSILNHGRLAERLVSQSVRPDFLRELHHQGASSFFRDLAVAQVWTINSVAVMREVLNQAEGTLSRAQEEAIGLRIRAEGAEKEVAGLRTRAEEAEGEAAGLRTRAEEAEGEAAGLRTRAEEAEGELARVRVQLSVARDNVLSRDARLDTLTAEMRVTEGRASSAEERVREVEEALAGEQAAKRAAEERASAAERRAAAAVEEYEKSPAFTKKVAEASAELYLCGFKDGKEKVGQIHGLSGLDDIEPDEAPEDQATSPEPAGDEAGPSDI